MDVQIDFIRMFECIISSTLWFKIIFHIHDVGNLESWSLSKGTCKLLFPMVTSISYLQDNDKHVSEDVNIRDLDMTSCEANDLQLYRPPQRLNHVYLLEMGNRTF